MIYFILDKSTDLVKIGYSKNPVQRLKQLQTGNGQSLELLYSIVGDRNYEAFLDKFFDACRVHGEWFNKRSVMNWIHKDRLERQVREEMELDRINSYNVSG